jgi:hypothetical protein
MCSRTTCRTCAKPTWKGCGNHIEVALAGVPKSQRCTCDRFATTANASTDGGLIARFFGR